MRYLLPTDAQAAFSSHKIELWATFGIYGLIAKGQGARELVDGGAGRTSGIGLLSASTKALADPAKRQAISDFVGRLARAVEWSKSHPEEYVKAYVDSSRVSPDIAKVLIAQGTHNLGPLSPDVQQTMQQVADTMIIAGTPKQVIAKLRILLEETRPGILGLWGNDGSVTHQDAKTCIRLMGQEVLPAVREIAKELDLQSPFETNQPVSVDYMPGRMAQPARAAAE